MSAAMGGSIRWAQRNGGRWDRMGGGVSGGGLLRSRRLDRSFHQLAGSTRDTRESGVDTELSSTTEGAPVALTAGSSAPCTVGVLAPAMHAIAPSTGSILTSAEEQVATPPLTTITTFCQRTGRNLVTVGGGSLRTAFPGEDFVVKGWR